MTKYRLYTYTDQSEKKLYLKQSLEEWTTNKHEAGIFNGSPPALFDDHQREDVEPAEEMALAGAERLPGF